MQHDPSRPKLRRGTCIPACIVGSGGVFPVPTSGIFCVLCRGCAYPSNEPWSDSLFDLDFCHRVQSDLYVGVQEIMIVRLALMTAYNMLFVVWSPIMFLTKRNSSKAMVSRHTENTKTRPSFCVFRMRSFLSIGIGRIMTTTLNREH